MTHKLSLLILLLLIACNKEVSDITPFKHTEPLRADQDEIGASLLDLDTKSYVYFSPILYPNFNTNFWLFEKASGKFIPKSKFPGKDRISLYLVRNGKELFGGLSKSASSATFKDWYIYDTTSNIWSAKTSTPYPIPAGMNITLSNNNFTFSCVYSINNIALCPIVYNITSNTWKRDSKNCDSTSMSCF